MAGDGSELVASKRKHEDEEEEGQSDEVTSSDVGEEGEGEEVTGSDVEEGSIDDGDDDDSAKTAKTSKGVIYCTFSDDEDFLLANGQKAESQVWENYFQQIHDSEGFDIVDFPGVTQMTPIVPLRLFKDKPTFHKKLQALAEFVIDEYNEANKEAYEVIDIVKVNSEVVAGVIYYFTLKVRNKKASNEEEMFQAKVWNGITEKELMLFRPQLKTAGN